MDAPDVSAIIPTFNGAVTLHRAVDSVFQQHGVKCEVCICDDGSQDCTPNVIVRLAACYIVRYTLFDTHRGQVAALNAATALARGRYLMFFGDDDWLEPGALARYVDALDKNPHVGFVYGGLQFHGARSDYHEPPEFNRDDYDHRFACMAALVFRREAWDNGCRWHEVHPAGSIADWDFVLQMIHRLGYVGMHVPGLLLHYTLSFNRMWAKTKANEEAILAVFRQRWPQVKANSL